METRLGRIHKIHLGYGGYQDAQFGITIDFRGPGWGVGSFIGFWGIDTRPDSYTKWNEADRDAVFASVVRKVNEWLNDAGRQRLNELEGVPVEITFKGNSLHSWRVLKEVL